MLFSLNTSSELQKSVQTINHPELDIIVHSAFMSATRELILWLEVFSAMMA